MQLMAPWPFNNLDNLAFVHPHLLANKNPLQVQLQDNKAPKTSPFISYSHLSSLVFLFLFSHLILFLCFLSFNFVLPALYFLFQPSYIVKLFLCTKL